MAVCSLRTLLLIVCILELIVTVQRQVFDFLGYMWLPIIANFTNIIFIIFGSFGAVQYVTKYLLSYSIWSCMWLTWNVFLICYYLNVGTLNRESGLLSLGTGSVSWWEGNGWGCQPVWGEADGPGTWRPARVDGCFLQWQYVELGQSSIAAFLAATALPLATLLTYRSFKKDKTVSDKSTLSRRQVFTIELSPTETNVNESSLKPMTPRRVKRRSGSRGAGSSVRRSRRSYRNAGYLASNSSLPRDPRPSRPTSAHSSYSNFHAARPSSYNLPERDVYEPPAEDSVPIVTNRTNTIRRSKMSRDVVGPYNMPEPQRQQRPADNATYDNIGRSYETVTNYENRSESVATACEPAYEANYGYGYDTSWDPPPPPVGARSTPQAPGPPAYQPAVDPYNVIP
ncbi:unnamed protein product [Danaus chrysippus]|uniref:Sodium/potassium-transporting ATPase subunit beta-1-interacting protein n=1 Tax=Danaus chrysippus TaxID=151541 RepID=A0A8J2R7X7_9NEOP|nr:unnamed protein product [Danaus chrysippus]